MVHNDDYLIKNINSSKWSARNILRNSYVCSADNYFVHNRLNVMLMNPIMLQYLQMDIRMNGVCRKMNLDILQMFLLEVKMPGIC